MQPKESGGGKAGETREAIVFKIAEDMLRKLPRDYVPHEVKDSLVRLGGLLPMNIFLRQEIDRMQRILTLGRLTKKDWTCWQMSSQKALWGKIRAWL